MHALSTTCQMSKSTQSAIRRKLVSQKEEGQGGAVRDRSYHRRGHVGHSGIVSFKRHMREQGMGAEEG